MKNYLYLLFAQQRFFWKIRNFTSKLFFKFRVKKISLKEHIESNKKGYGYFQKILKLSQNPMFIALLVAIIMQLTNFAIKPYVLKIKDYIKDNLFISFSEIQPSDYVTFLVIIATIGGVFIGLHYAGMSTLNGSLYSKLPSKVRNLLIQEKFGNIYIKFLSHLAYLSLILIAFRLYGFEHIYIVPFVMSIGVGVAIYAFVDLGKRVFYLFDPTNLSTVIFDNFFIALDNVKKGALYAEDNSFQSHNHNIARENIDTLTMLLTLAKEESKLSADSLVKLQRELLENLIFYQNTKQKIPSKSLWYEQKFKHKDWYRIDDSTTNIYYNSGVTPNADIVYDYFWVENRILPIIMDGIRENFENRRFDVVKKLLDSFLQYIEFMVHLEEIEFVIEQTEKLQKIVIEVIKEKKFDKNELEILGVFDSIMNIPILILVIFYKNINRYTYEKISYKLKNDNDKFDLYMLPELEILMKKLNYEYEIEGKKISPHWYQLEIMMLSVSKRFISNIHLIVSILEKIYKSTYRELDDIKYSYFKALILAKEWEYLKKINYQFCKIEDVLKEYKLEQKISTLNWKTIELNVIKDELKDREEKLLTNMSKNTLLAKEKTDDYPDFAGQFLHIMGEQLIDALCNNNSDIFTKIFPLYFMASLIKSEKLKPTSNNQNWVIEHELRVAITPVIDLIDISGYAKLLSKYYEDEVYWKTVKITWDNYLKNQKIEAKYFSFVIDLYESFIGIPHRSVNRMGWKQKIEKLFEKIPSKEFYRTIDGIAIYSPIIIIKHKNPLVRIFARRNFSGSFYDGIDIFISYFFRRLTNFKKLNFGRKNYKDLEKAVEHEKAFYKKYMKENDEK